MNLEKITPKCVPTGKVGHKGLLSDDFGSVTICYDDGKGLVKEADLNGLDPDKVKRTAWSNMRTEGCPMTDIYRTHGVKVKKPPTYMVKAPFGFDTLSLSWIAKVWNESVIYILPGSTEEAILVAGSEVKSGRMTEDKLKRLVRRANEKIKADQVAEILSDDVFCFENSRLKVI